MLFTPSLLTDLTGLLIALTAIVITYYKWSYTYWNRRGVPSLTPKIPWGNLTNPLNRKETIGLNVKKMYDSMRRKNWKHGGVYFMASPVYVVTDLEYVKDILTKNFQNFVDRGLYYNETDDPISAHLFAIGGPKWRNLRTKLTPTFTSGKMKAMFQTLLDCESNLQEKVEAELGKNHAIDIKDVFGCFTTDIIGSCAFGLDCNTFKEADSPFRKYGKKVFTSTPIRQLKSSFSNSFPKLAQQLGISVFPKDVSDFFNKVVKDTVEYREKNNYTRKDFMQLLIELKGDDLSAKQDGKSLTMDEITAQSFIFFLAGFETSSTTVTFALYELAKHQDVQQKVRDEIETVLAKYDGKVTYEAIQEMHYMTQVLNETLRKYPPVPFVTRQCVKEYKIPDQDVIIEKDIKVIIPILGIHRDQEYYPDPEKFDPERFSEENSKSRHPYTHIPFGEGPRICIGLRFGMMQSKVGLTSLLRKYNFTLNEKTVEPLKFSSKSFILAAEGDIWLDAQKV